MPQMSPEETTRFIREGLDLLSEAEVMSVRVTEAREAIIAYTVGAADLRGVQAEGVEVLIAVAAAIKNYGLDLETVMLVVGNPDGNVAGTILVYVDDLVAFYTGNLRRDELLARLVVTELADVVPVQAAPPTAVWTLAPAAAPTSAPAVVQPPVRQWNCTGDLYNCRDFSSRSEMESYIAACPGDPSDLDGDENGRACESFWD